MNIPMEFSLFLDLPYPFQLFKPSTMVKARVNGYAPVDGLLVATVNPKLVQGPVGGGGYTVQQHTQKPNIK